MKKSILFVFMAGFFFLASAALAAEGRHFPEKDRRRGHYSGHMATLVHQADINGYHLSYRLEKIQGQVKDTPDMGTHNLMLTIHDADKKAVDSAQVGYLVVNPDGSEQDVIAMGMGDGYGAAINLSAPGEYTIKCKAAVEEQALPDEFKYTIKPISSDSNN